MLTEEEITKALLEASDSNDLLPPRYEDKVSGELTKGFGAYLLKQLEANEYVPTKASFVQVPKPGFTSRPAALLTLEDRVIYEALVQKIRPRLNRSIADKDVVLWPRVHYSETKRWREFEHLPIEAGLPFVVLADIAGFYESIDHGLLEDRIVHVTGDAPLAKRLRLFLNDVMGRRRGIPQGLRPSDTLATLYLSPLDSALLIAGFDYWRHGDDIRVSASSMSGARRAISALEEEVRGLGMMVNSSKCTVQPIEEYTEVVNVADRVGDEVRRELKDVKIDTVANSEEQLTEVLESDGVDDQLAWDFFYHQSITLEELIEKISDVLEPSDIEIAERIFVQAVEGYFSDVPSFSSEAFHQTVSRSLVRLAAGRSDVAIEHASSLIAKYPDKSALVCSYLIAVRKGNKRAVLAQVIDILDSDLYLTEWQSTWLLRVVDSIGSFKNRKLVQRIEAIAYDESSHWLARVEALKVLANLEKIDGPALTRFWKLAPTQYRTDLVYIAAKLSDRNRWANRFLQGVAQEPVLQVVSKHYH